MQPCPGMWAFEVAESHEHGLDGANEYSSQAAIEDYIEDEDFDCKEKYIAWNQQDASEHIQEENDI